MNNKVDIEVDKFNSYMPEIDRKFNLKEAFQKNISSSEKVMNSRYLDIQAKYRKALSIYLQTKLSIGRLDTEIKEINIESVNKVKLSKVNSTKSYYLALSELKSPFLFLRSNIRVERLSNENIKLLETTTDYNSKELNNMVRDTIDKVLMVDEKIALNSDSNFMMNSNGSENVRNDSVVFWITYKVDYDEPLEESSKLKIEAEKEKKVKKIVEKYKVIFSNELNKDVNIFIHTED